MKKLTTGEEGVMRIIWEIGPCTIGQIKSWYEEHEPENPPVHSTLSTFLRILVEKEFLTYKVYGKTYEYTALISQKQYSKSSLKKFIESFFENRPSELVSFLIQNEKLDEKEISELVKQLKSKKK